MRIHYKKQWSNWNQKLLCVTHTERPTEIERCALNFLEKRYEDPKRLPPSVPFETLLPSSHFRPHLGDITIWEFSNGDFTKAQLLAHLSPKIDGYKPQFAIWHNDKLWILGIECIEVYNFNLSCIAAIKDPWLAGGHTLVPDYQGNLLASCSASDSVLVIDENTYQVTKALRLPEALYGFNYQLSRYDSTVEHFIDNDRQLAHINCAWPWQEGILVSTLIQGAIGWFNKSGSYRELLRGFVGMHGVRADERNNQLYFCDSTMGVMIFLTEDYQIEKRIDLNSVWLHDAQQLSGDIFAASVADRNQVEIIDTATREIINVIPCDEFGKGTQFLYWGC